MNVLYYNQSDLFSPQIEDLDDEYGMSKENEEYCSTSKSHSKTGKWLNLNIAPIVDPKL